MTRTITLPAVLLLALSSLSADKPKPPPPLEIGHPAPPLALKNHKGELVNLADFKDKNIVVLEWFNPGCPVTRRHIKDKTMTRLAADFRAQGVVWLGVNSTGSDREATARAVARHALNYDILLDATTAGARAFGAKTTPHLFIIDRSGKLAYAGAIDDDADGVKQPEQRVNYVKQALKELLASKPVSQPRTEPYGCAVHAR